MANSICTELYQNYAKTQGFMTNPEIITLEATVPTGMEKISLTEIIEKLNINVSEANTFISQGHIYFSTNIANYHKIKELRSIDNVHLVVDYHPALNFTDSEVDDLEKIKILARESNLMEGVKTWAQLTNFKNNIAPSREQHDEAKTIRDQQRLSGSENKREDLSVLKYRVTCTRALKHSFTSTKAQHIYGGELNDKYNWVVGLDDFDINILLKIVGNSILISLKLTQVSLHKRCLSELGPTSLRPTIAYNMLRLCNIKNGDLVVDPLCGGGSIPIEATYGYPASMVLCGDIHDLAVQRSSQNIKAITDNIKKPDIFHWDSEGLPFHDHSIDVICTDLPFGKRCCADIRQLYKAVLKEFSRVIKRDTGRVCILVHKAHNVIATLTTSLYIDRKLTINVGGLKCTVFLLRPKKY